MYEVQCGVESLPCLESPGMRFVLFLADKEYYIIHVIPFYYSGFADV